MIFFLNTDWRYFIFITPLWYFSWTWMFFLLVSDQKVYFLEFSFFGLLIFPFIFGFDSLINSIYLMNHILSFLKHYCEVNKCESLRFDKNSYFSLISELCLIFYGTVVVALWIINLNWWLLNLRSFHWVAAWWINFISFGSFPKDFLFDFKG